MKWEWHLKFGLKGKWFSFIMVLATIKSRDHGTVLLTEESNVYCILTDMTILY